MLIGIAIAHVLNQCWYRKYDWGEAFGIWYWQATAVFLYVFTAYLTAS